MKAMTSCHSLSIDIETYSSADLSKTGVYRYVESKDFEILLFAYSLDGGKVQVVDLARGEKIPSAILAFLEDDKCIKWAFNCSFERVCLSRFLGYPTGKYLNPKSWRCTMIWSATLGLPLSLEGVGKVLQLDKQKLTEGKELIKYFCVPCKPTKKNGQRTRNYYYHDSIKWDLFKEYNIRDVEVEIGIQNKLSRFPVSEAVWDEYHLDQEINDRGVKLDLTLVKQSIEIDTLSKTKLSRALQDLTELENPNSVMQMKMWLSKHGIDTEDLGKKTVVKLKEGIESGDIYDALTLRQMLSKSSIKKYEAMKNAVCSDGRARGMFQFYGANRTGRFAGRLIQLQNLPQNHLEDLDVARELVKQGNVEALNMLYEDIPDTLSQLIRTAFVCKPHTRLCVADFSAIEARVIAWLSGETWRLKTFEKGEDIYCASASQMFKVPVEKHGVNSHLRQKGKIAELALGYGGSIGALKSMGALEMGLNEDELEPLVRMWRESNPNIVKLWWDIDKAVKYVIDKRCSCSSHGIKFTYESGFLFITLPSGRRLAYVKPKIIIDDSGKESITYEGVGTTRKWERLESYGPKFVENIVQGIARDILCESMMRLKDYEIIMHIHDEVVIEATDDISLEHICDVMGKVPSWSEGLILRADGYETKFYKKD